VAGATALLILGCYVLAVLVLNLVIVHRLTAQLDARLTDRLSAATTQGSRAEPASRSLSSDDVDDPPSFLWRVAPTGSVTALTPQAPALPAHQWRAGATQLDIGTTPFRFQATRRGIDWLVIGQSSASVQRVAGALWLPELLFGSVLVLAVFGGAVVIGRQASAPLELVQERQAAFTADASHELRTPLSVIEAEVALALSRSRDSSAYQAALRRIGDEGHRLRQIVDDLLWLARADKPEGAVRPSEPADVAALAAELTERFAVVADSRGVALTYEGERDSSLLVWASGAWIERLVGVLVDNACKFAGRGGTVRVSVRPVGNHIHLQVDDTGPGIEDDELPFIFDRFHRSAGETGGTGLGLAIADSVVRATGGTWSVGRSTLGGARMQVWWRRAGAAPTGVAVRSGSR